ncbi:tetratricopeptide repeat protein [Frondihabitans cladoniiphilus]|uniref:tetratricopeptide repeat protein n=1 Tax=Frondihabitans cladoniiphilus TaxID=715785 RepID=UPI0031F066D7
MEDTWDDRVARFWETADDEDAPAVLAAMKLLVDERPAGDPEALFEWASAHDFLGHESEAIPLYRRALEAGLPDERHFQAQIQLASSLRNVGEFEQAIDILRGRPDDPVTGAAGSAFLALAFLNSGRAGAAVGTALTALAPTLPMYGRAVAEYANDWRSLRGLPPIVEDAPGSDDGTEDDGLDDDDDDDSDAGHVIFSLDVLSLHAIPALSGLSSLSPNIHPRDNFQYRVHHESFTESNWSLRADRVEATLTAALDTLEATQVDLAALHHPDVFVRAFFTFGSGAETIHAEALQRLAKFNATLWIDA